MRAQPSPSARKRHTEDDAAVDEVTKPSASARVMHTVHAIYSHYKKEMNTNEMERDVSSASAFIPKV